MTNRPFLLLLVLDGFGCRAESDWNAIAQAETPCFDRLFRESAWTTLEASGLAVGLPAGQMGNSEVGHLGIGAGRVVDQDIVRISKAVEHGELAANPALVAAVEKVKRNGGALHVAGLLSDGGVHAHQAHIHGLVAAALALGAPRVFIHAILDGRDTPPRSAGIYLRELAAFLADKPAAKLATMTGRYYTMDRDSRWERVQRGYDLMTLAAGAEGADSLAALERSYSQGIGDEFVEPVGFTGAEGRVRDGDALVFANFRADRMRQIVSAFTDAAFAGFERAARPEAEVVTMNSYHEDWTLPVLFPPQEVRNHLGAVLAEAGLTQLRIAETEKYAHVTFFFNGGSDARSPGEDRLLVPSPKVATYDLRPEMSARELAARVAEDILARKHDVVIMNIANPDMVGHTGVMDAAVKAVHATDEAVAAVLHAVESVNGVALITADHGNCELMFDPGTDQPSTSHTTNPVPLILVDARKRHGRLRAGGALADVAPTALEILGLEKPAEMTGESLLLRSEA